MGAVDDLKVQAEVDRVIMDETLWSISTGQASTNNYPKVTPFDEAVISGVVKALRTALPQSTPVVVDVQPLHPSSKSTAVRFYASEDDLLKARENIKAKGIK